MCVNVGIAQTYFSLTPLHFLLGFIVAFVTVLLVLSPSLLMS